MISQVLSAQGSENRWVNGPVCESWVRNAICCPFVPLSSNSQVTSESAFPLFFEDCGKMADNDNRKPADREETWESLGDIIARLLREIAQKRGAA
jgi:hypothetical protein